jgi:SAM-dependent methyltransferase
MQHSDLIHLSKSTTVSMSDEWYQFTNPKHFWMAWRLNVMKILLPLYDLPREPILEIGTGSGVARLQIEESFGKPVDGCDLNETALKLATKGRGKLMLYDIFECRDELKIYNTVFLLDVIEHLDDDLTFLKAAIAHLKPGGNLVINVPAWQLFYSRYDATVGHKRRYNRKQMNRLLESCGIEPIKTTYWGLFLVPLLVARIFVLRFTREEQIVKTGFEPPGKISNFFLRFISSIEGACFKVSKGLPMGTSLFAIGKLRK